MPGFFSTLTRAANRVRPISPKGMLFRGGPSPLHIPKPKGFRFFENQGEVMRHASPHPGVAAGYAPALPDTPYKILGQYRAKPQQQFYPDFGTVARPGTLTHANRSEFWPGGIAPGRTMAEAQAFAKQHPMQLVPLAKADPALQPSWFELVADGIQEHGLAGQFSPSGIGGLPGTLPQPLPSWLQKLKYQPGYVPELVTRSRVGLGERIPEDVILKALTYETSVTPQQARRLLLYNPYTQQVGRIPRPFWKQIPQETRQLLKQSKARSTEMSVKEANPMGMMGGGMMGAGIQQGMGQALTPKLNLPVPAQAQLNTQSPSGPGTGGAATTQGVGQIAAANPDLPQLGQAGMLGGGAMAEGTMEDPNNPGQPQAAQQMAQPPAHGVQPGVGGALPYMPGEGPVTGQAAALGSKAAGFGLLCGPLSPFGLAGLATRADFGTSHRGCVRNPGGVKAAVDALSMVELQQRARQGVEDSEDGENGDSTGAKTPEQPLPPAANFAESFGQLNAPKLARHGKPGGLRRSAVGEGNFEINMAPWSVFGEDAWPSRDEMYNAPGGKGMKGTTRTKISMLDALPLTDTAKGFLDECLRMGFDSVGIAQAVKTASALDAAIAADLAPLEKLAFRGGLLPRIGRAFRAPVTDFRLGMRGKMPLRKLHTSPRFPQPQGTPMVRTPTMANQAGQLTQRVGQPLKSVQNVASKGWNSTPVQYLRGAGKGGLIGTGLGFGVDVADNLTGGMIPGEDYMQTLGLLGLGLGGPASMASTGTWGPNLARLSQKGHRVLNPMARGSGYVGDRALWGLGGVALAERNVQNVMGETSQALNEKIPGLELPDMSQVPPAQMKDAILTSVETWMAERGTEMTEALAGGKEIAAQLGVELPPAFDQMSPAEQFTTLADTLGPRLKEMREFQESGVSFMQKIVQAAEQHPQMVGGFLGVDDIAAFKDALTRAQSTDPNVQKAAVAELDAMVPSMTVSIADQTGGGNWLSEILNSFWPGNPLAGWLGGMDGWQAGMVMGGLGLGLFGLLQMMGGQGGMGMIGAGLGLGLLGPMMFGGGQAQAGQPPQQQPQQPAQPVPPQEAGMNYPAFPTYDAPETPYPAYPMYDPQSPPPGLQPGWAPQNQLDVATGGHVN